MASVGIVLWGMVEGDGFGLDTPNTFCNFNVFLLSLK